MTDDPAALLRDPSRASRNRVRHVGIIPDGTRRWARDRGESLDAAYRHAMLLLAQHAQAIYMRGAVAVSLYLSSAYNFRRDPEEVRAFCDAEAYLCSELIAPLAEEMDVRAIHAGDLTRLPPNLCAAMTELTSKTSGRASRRLYLCAAYDPIEELEVALSRCGRDDFLRHLWVPEPLDVVIRTSGATLLSNFLPLQARYAQLVFLDSYFNDIETSQIEAIMQACMDREWFFGS